MTSEISHKGLGDWLASEPFTLVMSSGFFGFFAHAGLVAALYEAGLRPARVAGSSAGALVGGMLAGGLMPADMADNLNGLQRDEFWDPAVGPGLLAGRKFRRRLWRDVGRQDVSGLALPASLVIHDLISGRPEAPVSGDLATLIHASCAVPVMFHPVWWRGRPYIDGGVTDRPGMTGIAPGERVFYHHLGTRSPWRKKGSPSLEIPRRDNMRHVEIAGLPRVHPFALERGREAYDCAKRAMAKALVG